MATAGEENGEYDDLPRFSSFPFRSGGRDVYSRVDEATGVMASFPHFSSTVQIPQAQSIPIVLVHVQLSFSLHS